MKPSLNPKALQAAIVVMGGVLVAVANALVSFPDLLDPRWVVLIGTIGGLLAGKEALQGSTHIKVSDLPLEWQERKTDPQ